MSPGVPPTPFRVHRVIARLNVGGPALHVVNLARGLEAHGFTTRLVAGRIGGEEGDMAYYARSRGVSVTELPTMARAVDLRGDVATYRHLVRLFRRERPHVVHTHTAKAGALGRLAARAAGVPVVVHTFHGHVLGGDYFSPVVTGFYRAVERVLARATDRLVVLTERQRIEMSETLRIAAPERFQVVPLGLDLEHLAELERGVDASEGRRRIGVAAGRPVVGIVGRLVPIKDHELALHALAAVHERWRDSGGAGAPPLLAVVGGGSEERTAELRALAGTLGLSPHVRWLGWQKELAPLYAAMDVLLLTSKDEGTPVAIIEALAAGTPVVATGVGGIPEILADLPRGHRIVDGRRPSDLARAVMEALGGGGVRSPARVDEGMRRRVADHWSVERLCADVATLYRELLTGAGIAAAGAG